MSPEALHDHRFARWAACACVIAATMRIGAAQAADIAIAPNAAPTATRCEPVKVGDEDFDSPSIETSITSPFAAARQQLRDCGIRTHAIYTNDLFGNVSGGISRGANDIGRLELGVQADLEKVLGWSGATFTATGFLIHGHGVTTDRLGNLLPVSNAEAVPTARLFELWLEQKIGSIGSLRVGQLAADTEFITSDNAAVFINGTFGWPGITAANLPSGGPAYPLATPGARLELDFGPQTKFRAAIFNGDPAGPGEGDPQRRDRYGVNFRVQDSPFLIAELQQSYALGTGKAALPGSIKLGAWYHTGTFADQRFDTAGLPLADAALTNGNPALHRGDWGSYAILDQTLFRLPGEGERSVGAFARVSFSPDDRNLIDFYADGGIGVKGPFAARPDDTFGIAFGYAHISDSARGFDRDTIAFSGTPMPVRDYEAVLEITYQAQIAPGWTLQPDFQYIIHPGGNVPDPNDPTGTRAVKNAAVFGLRTVLRY